MTDRIAIIADTGPIDPQIIASHMRYLPGWDIRVISDFEASISGYNRLLTSKELWESLPEHVLVFQQDSELFTEIPEWMMEFSFIGAPIKWISGSMNGGLSLRKKSDMLNAISNYRYNGETEDLWFCEALKMIGCFLPTKLEAQQFSVETEFHLGSVGCHAIDKYLSVNECKQIRTQYDWRL